MFLWIVYDISSTRIRNKVFQLCKDYGLFSVQKSCFTGYLNKKNEEKFLQKLSQIGIEEDDSIYRIPSSRKQLLEVEVLGKGFDKKMVMQEYLVISV